jgi:hypothetical protein
MTFNVGTAVSSYCDEPLEGALAITMNSYKSVSNTPPQIHKQNDLNNPNAVLPP